VQPERDAIAAPLPRVPRHGTLRLHGPEDSFIPLLKRPRLSPITFHDLRHTCASLMFQRKVHPKFVQELLGHASVAITLDKYSHMLPGMSGEAADAMGEVLG
jgi:integrase